MSSSWWKAMQNSAAMSRMLSKRIENASHPESRRSQLGARNVYDPLNTDQAPGRRSGREKAPTQHGRKGRLTCRCAKCTGFSETSMLWLSTQISRSLPSNLMPFHPHSCPNKNNINTINTQEHDQVHSTLKLLRLSIKLQASRLRHAPLASVTQAA